MSLVRKSNNWAWRVVNFDIPVWVNAEPKQSTKLLDQSSRYEPPGELKSRPETWDIEEGSNSVGMFSLFGHGWCKTSAAMPLEKGAENAVGMVGNNR